VKSGADVLGWRASSDWRGQSAERASKGQGTRQSVVQSREHEHGGIELYQEECVDGAEYYSDKYTAGSQVTQAQRRETMYTVEALCG
jgi:hypothetical protein